MVERIARGWWVLAVRGGLAVLFGILAILVPGAALTALVTLFGVYALVDGVFALLTAARFTHTDERWGLLVIEGIVGVVAGIVSFAHPAATALALVYLVAAWAILTGLVEIAAALRLRKVIAGEWALGALGVISLLLGIGLLAAPRAALITLVWMIGAYALLFGLGLLSLAWRLRRLNTDHERNRAPVWPPP
jgi:uncharacterized membrane protein HdeD (DUF308 family)